MPGVCIPLSPLLTSYILNGEPVGDEDIAHQPPLDFEPDAEDHIVRRSTFKYDVPIRLYRLIPSGELEDQNELGESCFRRNQGR